MTDSTLLKVLYSTHRISQLLYQQRRLNASRDQPKAAHKSAEPDPQQYRASTKSDLRFKKQNVIFIVGKRAASTKRK